MLHGVTAFTVKKSVAGIWPGIKPSYYRII